MPVKYKKGEFCEAENCGFYELLMSGDVSRCINTCWAYKLHDYLTERGYEILKFAENEHFLTIKPCVFDDREPEDDD